jgi:hypothetical protein
MQSRIEMTHIHTNGFVFKYSNGKMHPDAQNLSTCALTQLLRRIFASHKHVFGSEPIVDVIFSSKDDIATVSICPQSTGSWVQPDGLEIPGSYFTSEPISMEMEKHIRDHYDRYVEAYLSGSEGGRELRYL